jgi:hypothetical protein
MQPIRRMWHRFVSVAGVESNVGPIAHHSLDQDWRIALEEKTYVTVGRCSGGNAERRVGVHIDHGGCFSGPITGIILDNASVDQSI